MMLIYDDEIAACVNLPGQCLSMAGSEVSPGEGYLATILAILHSCGVT